MKVGLKEKEEYLTEGGQGREREGGSVELLRP